MDDEISRRSCTLVYHLGRPPTRFFFNLNFRKKDRRTKNLPFYLGRERLSVGNKEENKEREREGEILEAELQLKNCGN